jgi:hypothetical protein
MVDMKESIKLLKAKEEMARAETEAVRLVACSHSSPHSVHSRFWKVYVTLAIECRFRDSQSDLLSGRVY